MGTIATDLHLVLAAADYDGLLLDVHCTLDEDGYELAALTLHGDLRDLMPALSDSCIKQYTRWVEDNTKAPASVAAFVKARTMRELRAAYGGNPALHPA